jgi:RNA binding exosome subunit
MAWMIRLRKARCRVHCYSTENPDKVRRAVENLIKDTHFTVRATSLEGHYGDIIKVYEYDILDENDVARLLRKIVKAVGISSLGVEEKSGAGGRIHVRLSKQKAYGGVVDVEEFDPVKIEFTYEGDWREIFRWQESTQTYT